MHNYRLLGLVLVLVLSLFYLGCSSVAGSSLSDKTDAYQQGLPFLPDDGPAVPRETLASATAIIDGSDTQSVSPAGTSVHATEPWLVLDGDLSANYTYAIWRFPLTVETVIESFRVNPVASGLNKYWIGYADYNQNRWVFSDEKFGATLFSADASANLHSPGEFCYLVMVVLAGNKMTIASLEMTADNGSSSGDDPIFDQFENNDIGNDDDENNKPYQLGEGIHRASIHEVLNLGMSDPDEWRDVWDFYRITIPAGQYLTTTLRHEVYDHFWDGADPEYPFPNQNDLDILFYLGETSDPLNDFTEQYSSTNIYYQPFEQSLFQSGGGQDVIIGIRGEIDLAFGIKSNAEYYLGIHLSEQVYTVSGVVKVDDSIPDRDVIVFLEPGNFNYVTDLPGSPGANPGAFEIEGVPPGEYTVKVHGSARQGPTDYVWPETTQVTVVSWDVTGLDVDISGYGP